MSNTKPGSKDPLQGDSLEQYSFTSLGTNVGLVGRENVNTKRQHSDGSSLSSPLHPSKRQNYEDQNVSPQSAFRDPFSPSASEVIDSKFQDIIVEVLSTDPMVKKVLEKMINNSLNQKIRQQQDQISFLQGMVDSLTLKVNQLEEESEYQRNTSDHLEQYSRRHSLRIINNWPESHRVGPLTMNRTRPVITKLRSYKTKARIYQARNRLNFAGPGARQIHINEDLTKTRSTFLKVEKQNK